MRGTKKKQQNEVREEQKPHAGEGRARAVLPREGLVQSGWVRAVVSFRSILRGRASPLGHVSVHVPVRFWQSRNSTIRV